MAGSLGKPSGSMAPAGLVDDIRAKRELEQLEQMAKKTEQVDKDKEELRAKERQKEIDGLLPKELNCVFGQLSYATFKEIYKDVFDGVAAKEHFALGYLMHETDLPGGGKLKVRTFRRNEADALRGLAPKMAVFEQSNVEEFNAENSRFLLARMAVAVIEFDGRNVELSRMPTVQDLNEWLDSKEVKAKIDFLNGLPDELVGFINGVIMDVSVAYRLAATENLKNRLAPLSRITA